MKFRPCSREQEITGALKDGRWPQGCDAELRAHVDACRGCSDLVLVTQTFQKARHTSSEAAHLDSPDLVWWRIQLRRRNAAVKSVAKPLAVAQTFAVLVNVLVIAGFAAWQVRHGLGWASLWASLQRSNNFHWDSLWSFASMKLDWLFLLLFPSLGALALLSGVVLYLASDKQ